MGSLYLKVRVYFDDSLELLLIPFVYMLFAQFFWVSFLHYCNLLEFAYSHLMTVGYRLKLCDSIFLQISNTFLNIHTNPNNVVVCTVSSPRISNLTRPWFQCFWHIPSAPTIGATVALLIAFMAGSIFLIHYYQIQSFLGGVTGRGVKISKDFAIFIF